MDDKEVHEARSLMARNSTERVAWWQVRYGVERICFFSAHQVLSRRKQHINSPSVYKMWYYADFKGGDVFAPLRVGRPSTEVISSFIFIAFYVSINLCFCYTDESSGIRKYFTSMKTRA